MADNPQQQAQQLDFGKLLLELPPYDPYAAPSALSTLELDFYSGTIDSYCPQCARESVFRRNPRFPQVMGPRIGNWIRPTEIGLFLRGEVNRVQLDWEDTVFGPVGPLSIDEHLAHRFIRLRLECSRSPSHHLYILFLAQGNQIVKIGQFPSVADLQEETTKRYRKVLGDRFPELRRAVGLASHGVGIGAYVYLRRMLEVLLEEAPA